MISGMTAGMDEILLHDRIKIAGLRSVLPLS